MVSVERVTGSEGKPDILVKLDRNMMETHGKQAIQDFLMKLQVRRTSYLMWATYNGLLMTWTI